MKLIEGLLDYSKPWRLPDVYLFTGNPVIKLDGSIVMGRGAAKQVRDSYPGIDREFGKVLQSQYRDNDNVLFLVITHATEQFIGWFKVKYHWREPADLRLIRQSTAKLAEIALDAADKTFHMNYPGIGNGQLTEADVGPILELLPDNVQIYR